MKLSVVSLFFYTLVITIGIKPLYGNEWLFQAAKGEHHGRINAIIHKGNNLISAGDDGFLGIWDIQRNASIDRYQISPHKIIAMAGRPQRDEVCVIESDRLGFYRLSAWNYRTRRNIFSIPMDQPVSYITYSTGGNYIIACGAVRSGLLFFDSNNGRQLQSSGSLRGNVNLAVTGASEKNIMIYLSSGEISYWDIELKTELLRFDAPANLTKPVLFSRNRFLAGINSNGLSVINAVSGGLIDTDASINQNALLYPLGDDLLCFVQKDRENAEIINYQISNTGSLVKDKQSAFSISGFNENVRFTAICTIGNTGNIALGSENGIAALAARGSISPMAVKNHSHITDAAVFDGNLAFIADNGVLGIIPLDYKELSQGRSIFAEQNMEAFNRISTFDSSRLILWQNQNTRTSPILYTSNAEEDMRKQDLSGIRFRSSLRSVASFNGKIMFLDSSGNLSVISPLAENPRPFSYFSVGLLDAAFIDNEHLLLGRSAVSDNSVFLSLNIETGETVPISFAAQAGLKLYRGTSGSIYAVTISMNENDETVSSLLLLDPADMPNSFQLAVFKSEGAVYSLAEAPGGRPGRLAFKIDGEEAAIYSRREIQRLERTHGLPEKFIENRQFVISLDRDGCLVWHDHNNGKPLAVFWLSPEGWNLHTEQRTITGGF